MSNRAVWISLLLAFVVSSLSVGKCLAEELLLGTAPSNPMGAGFRMEVFSPRLGADGYQPIRLEFTANGKQFGRQRNLRILFRPRTEYARELDFQFTCDVSVPQGVKRYERSILIPHYYRWENCSVRVLEDGQQLGKFPSSMRIDESVKAGGQSVSIGIVIPRDAKQNDAPWKRFPDLRTIVTIQGDGPIDKEAEAIRLDDQKSRDYLDKLRFGRVRFRLLDEDRLPQDWIGHSQLDILLIAFPVLQRIESEQPAVLHALKMWCVSGGQIWSYAAPQTIASDNWLASAKADPQHIRFNADMRLSLKLNGDNDQRPLEYQAWNNSFSTSYSSTRVREKRRTAYSALEKAKHPMVAQLNRTELLAQFRVMPVGMGRVVLIEAEDPFPGSFQFWNALETDYQHWATRHGVQHASGNDSYWGWLITAVGQPPVNIFVILNGLFVIVMGPVLYFMLRKRSRLYLLYFLAPALAFLVTSSLFLYAFLSDGFDNRARVRQLSWIDARQPVDEDRYAILNQSRQTYYTVVDSRQGLRFSNDRLAFPVLHQEQIENYSYYPANSGYSGDYLIDQGESARHFRGDFLPTRSQVHFLVTRPEFGALPVEIDLTANPITVTNRLSTPIDYLAVRDGIGRGRGFWLGSSIAPGATVELAPKDYNTMLRLASEVVGPNSESLPVAYRSFGADEDPTFLESELDDFLQNPQAKSFVLTTTVDESEFALRDCVAEGSVRFIGGLLP